MEAARSSTTGATRCAPSCSRARSSGSSATTSTACAWTRSPRCSTSTTARKDGEWIPNAHGGKENLEAIAVPARSSTIAVDREHSRTCASIAEESTAWPAVSRPVLTGGLGFGMKWNMGWMHDTLELLRAGPDPPPLPPRRAHVLALVRVHRELRAAALARRGGVRQGLAHRARCPATAWQQFANLRLLLRLDVDAPGQEAALHGRRVRPAARVEPRARARLGARASARSTRGVQRWVARPEPRSTASEPALHQRDFAADGFEWIDAQRHREQRAQLPAPRPTTSRPVLVVCNFTPVVRYDYRVGVPRGGAWRERAQQRCARLRRQRRGQPGARRGRAASAWHGRAALAARSRCRRSAVRGARRRRQRMNARRQPPGDATSHSRRRSRT